MGGCEWPCSVAPWRAGSTASAGDGLCCRKIVTRNKGRGKCWTWHTHWINVKMELGWQKLNSWNNASCLINAGSIISKNRVTQAPQVKWMLETSLNKVNVLSSEQNKTTFSICICLCPWRFKLFLSNSPIFRDIALSRSLFNVSYTVWSWGKSFLLCV